MILVVVLVVVVENTRNTWCSMMSKPRRTCRRRSFFEAVRLNSSSTSDHFLSDSILVRRLFQNNPTLIAPFLYFNPKPKFIDW